MTLGQRIQKSRKESGLSQEELAELLGVSRQAISKWENDNGYPEMEKMIRLSQIYQVSLDYLVGNEQTQPDENESAKGWYISNELAESFLSYQKLKYIKIGLCFLLIYISNAFNYVNLYYEGVGNTISDFMIIIAIILLLSVIVSDNPYKKIWSEPLIFDNMILKQLRIKFSENKKRFKIMLLGGTFAFLTGCIFSPEIYWAIPNNLLHAWYALSDIISGIGGYFAIYAWGIQRAYKVLTKNHI